MEIKKSPWLAPRALFKCYCFLVHPACIAGIRWHSEISTRRYAYATNFRPVRYTVSLKLVVKHTTDEIVVVADKLTFIIFLTKSLLCQENNLFGIKTISEEMVNEKVNQLVRSNRVFSFLHNLVPVRRQKLRTDRRVDNIQKNILQILSCSAKSGIPFNQILNKRFGNRAVNIIHTL